ncbi:MAG: GNAT family N-acetyltransferase [Steroidobacteraceae bacterium]
MTAGKPALVARELASIDEVDAAAWNRLAGTDCPFLRHEFLAALEHSGCATPRTGWTGAHRALFDGDTLVAAAPAYRKDHSWGEFVFDFAWAQAWARAGRAYYPKLVCAVPFSPVGGQRLLTLPGRDAAQLRSALVRDLAAAAVDDGLSSAHALFINAAEHECFAAQQWLLRRDVQFHWYNAHYRDFEHYLEGFTAEKRKKLRRERRRCAEAGIEFMTLHGPQIDAATLGQIHALHAANFHRHGHEPYLNLAFFREIRTTLGETLMVKLARHRGRVVGAAVFFRSPTVLYGRYWGACEDFHSLHFETCYHQGIEYCIAEGLERFEPGTQGEHKVARGFAPQLTWSAHYIVEPDLRAALAEHLRREGHGVDAYAGEIGLHTPFRRG